VSRRIVIRWREKARSAPGALQLRKRLQVREGRRGQVQAGAFALPDLRAAERRESVAIRLVRSLGAAVRKVTRLGGLLMPELPTTVLGGLAADLTRGRGPIRTSPNFTTNARRQPARRWQSFITPKPDKRQRQRTSPRRSRRDPRLPRETGSFRTRPPPSLARAARLRSLPLGPAKAAEARALAPLGGSAEQSVMGLAI
jgi:hypothetical protein